MVNNKNDSRFDCLWYVGVSSFSFVCRSLPTTVYRIFPYTSYACIRFIRLFFTCTFSPVIATRFHVEIFCPTYYPSNLYGLSLVDLQIISLAISCIIQDTLTTLFWLSLFIHLLPFRWYALITHMVALISSLVALIGTHLLYFVFVNVLLWIMFSYSATLSQNF